MTSTSLPARDAVDHTPGRAQRWPDVDEDLREWTDAIVARAAQLNGLVGVYLHGSLAMGGFHRPKSDLDLLVVTDTSLDDQERSALASDALELLDQRPIVGGVELSVVLHRSVAAFQHPAPYEFHFSETWADDVRAGGSGPTGTDPDLAAHCTVARSRGVALIGAPPREVFGEVPRSDYLDAVLDDLRWIVDGGILESPFYGVLNVCRSSLVTLGEASSPPSKEEAARWALEHVPEQHHRIIADALACYRSAAPIAVELRRHHGHRWDEQRLRDLATWARETLPRSAEGDRSRARRPQARQHGCR